MDLSLLFKQINDYIRGVELQDFAVPTEHEVIPFYKYLAKFKESLLSGRRKNEEKTRKQVGDR